MVVCKVDYLISCSDWIDVDCSVSVKLIVLKVCDGLLLYGFLILLVGSDGCNLLMVVMLYGGLFDIFDFGQYDCEMQMLVVVGYVVLQVNFCGLGNYGWVYIQVGVQQWGVVMQDDVIDVICWVISEGIVDGCCICIYGVSYGVYLVMMGVVCELGLYQCVVGYVGVYDLLMMYICGDIQDCGLGVIYLCEWLGDLVKLGVVLLVNLVEWIKVLVFLVVGGEDKCVLIQYIECMEVVFKCVGMLVESLYYKIEGYGFYIEVYCSEYYDKLLVFLVCSLGGKIVMVVFVIGKDKVF